MMTKEKGGEGADLARSHHPMLLTGRRLVIIAAVGTIIQKERQAP